MAEQAATNFHSDLIQAALDAGFPLAGALDIDRADITEHVSRYDAWIAGGHEGAMEYLRRGRDRRADPRLVFPEARSVLCVAIPYSRAAISAESGPRYARYLNGPDYHKRIAEMLEGAMQGLKLAHPELRWKTCVDTSAVLERSWAALAGLGWIGKNTTLIHPKLGSYLFLGEVLLNLETGEGPKPLPNFCGNCTRCLEGCPTGALVEPGRLDSNRCISYWTLEKRGELPISDDERRGIGRWIAGCDICQEVCPFNLKPARGDAAHEPSGAVRLQDWESLLLETPEQYRERVKDSALKRIKPEQFSRNLAIALTNLSADELRELEPLIRSRAAAESDAIAVAEWARCLDRLN